MMRHFYLVLLLTVSVFLNTALAALTLTVTNTGKAVDLGTLTMGEGFYYEPAGHVTMQVNKDGPADVYVYANLTSLLTNSNGFTIPADVLRWKGFWISTNSVPNNGGNFVKGVSTAAKYKLNTDDPIARITATSTIVNMTLGTEISSIPAVQPVGTYTTRIIYSIVE